MNVIVPSTTLTTFGQTPLGNQAGQIQDDVTSCPSNEPWLLFQEKLSVGSGAFEYRQNHGSELVPLFSTHLSNSCSGAGCERSTLSRFHSPVSGEPEAEAAALAKSATRPLATTTATRSLGRAVRMVPPFMRQTTLRVSLTPLTRH